MKKVTATPSDDDDDGDSEEVDAPRRSTRSKKQGAPPSLHPSRMPSSADSQSLLAHYGRGRQVNRQVEGRQRCHPVAQAQGQEQDQSGGQRRRCRLGDVIRRVVDFHGHVDDGRGTVQDCQDDAGYRRR
jgi:hypothetical protein